MNASKMRLRWLFAAFSVCAVALVGAGCGGSDDSDSSTGADGQELTKVTVMSDFAVPWVPQVPWAVALDKGWFEEEGVDVDYIPPQGAAAPARLVGAGKVDMAAVYTADVMSTNEEGLKSKVLMSQATEKLPGGICYYADSGIETPKDLEGKTVAVYDYPQGEYNFKHFLEANGVDESKVNVVSAGANSAQLLIAEKVDAIDGATALECPDAEIKSGKEVDTFLFDDSNGFPKGYFLELAANEKWLGSNEKAARAVVETLQRAQSWSEQNKDEALQIFIDSDPDNIVPEVAELSWENLQDSWCGESASCWNPDKPIGWIDPKIWADQATFYKEGGLLKSDGPEASSMLTDNEYLSDQYMPKP